MFIRRRSLALLGAVATISAGALALSTIPSGTTEAAAGVTTFVVPANDGYGVADCVSSGAPCAQVVADAWCEAQGFARSTAYGPVDVDVTGSVTTNSRPISVTCSDAR